MAEIIALGVASWLFYYLFIKGNAWPILLLIFAIFGGRLMIMNYFPSSSATVITFINYEISWATFVATLICILGIGVIMERLNNE